jgi:hypothetical protein
MLSRAAGLLVTRVLWRHRKEPGSLVMEDSAASLNVVPERELRL